MATTSKIRVAILFGGKSAEHEVSLKSAYNVLAALDPEKYEPVLIGIGKDGVWRSTGIRRLPGRLELPPTLEESAATSPGVSSQGSGSHASAEASAELSLALGARDLQISGIGPIAAIGAVDVVFPVLHGPYGEDGSVQGLLKLANVPFVGPGVLGSAVGMDKDVMKRLLRDAGIGIANFRTFLAHERPSIVYEDLIAVLGSPLFIKPANLGSSVGISKVSSRDELPTALDKAFRFDRKIVIEAAVVGREIEVAVLGNEAPKASVPGEVISNAANHGFYSYEAKYLDEKGAALVIPADLPPEKAAEIRGLAIQTYQTLCCEGMARVDFFLQPDGTVLVNEINTIPGFTAVSMYPKLWEATGLSYGELLSELIQLAMRRFEAESGLATSVS
ncbi:MAG: D-alanine--D-alanine ligase family protein [Fibrobacteria bacterium]